MNAMADQLLNFFSRAHADLLQALGAIADDDLLLRVTLDENRAVDARETCAHLFPTLSDNGGDVRNFFAGGFEDLFAHDLSSEHAHRLISEFIFREDRLALWQMIDDFADQRVELIAFQR